MAKLDESHLAELTASLDAWGAGYDAAGAWPQQSIDHLGRLGAWRWTIPAEYGGDPLAHADLLRAYEAMSAGCMSTALVITQRDGAVDLIVTSANKPLRERHLPALARGEYYTTVGISQLTTSRRGGGHLMAAAPDGDGYRLDGLMPWATGAERAKIIVTGAVLPDGQQILACVPTDRAGLRVDEPDDLLTLNPSRTSCVFCENYRVEPEEIMRGPAEQVLSLRTPVKPLVTSACGIGVAGALRAYLMSLRSGIRSHFQDVLIPLEEQYQQTREQLSFAAQQVDDPGHESSASEIRIRVNEIVLRSALVALTFGKGSGFLKSKPLERHVREALFFLVWSVPPSVQLETLVRLFGQTVGPG